jgi:hypothetical protein
LRGYVDDLANPPLLVCCDLVRFQIHTNFTGLPPETIRFTVAALSDPAILDTLRCVFTDPSSFQTSGRREAVTQAALFGKPSGKSGSTRLGN